VSSHPESFSDDDLSSFATVFFFSSPSFKTLKVLISSGSSSIAFSFVFPGGLPIKAVSQGRVLGNHQGDKILSQEEEYSLIFNKHNFIKFRRFYF